MAKFLAIKRRPTKRAPRLAMLAGRAAGRWGLRFARAARFASSISLASSFPCSQALSTPARWMSTQTIGQVLARSPFSVFEIQFCSQLSK